MSNRYTASKKGRTHGAYAKRLEARGLHRAERMDSLRTLRNKAKADTSDLPKEA